MSVAHYARADAQRPLPNYVGVNPIVRYDNFTIAGPGYLGEAYAPFAVTGDPNAPDFRVPGVGIADGRSKDRLRGRMALRQSFDTLRRDLDRSGSMGAMDCFEGQAVE